jgi:hypothetical protein
MLRQWLECIEWIDKEEALMESTLSLDSNGESNPFEDRTHLILEESLDETNPSYIQYIHEESILETKDEDDINEHGIYSITTTSNPCSYETSPNSIGLPSFPIFKISNPLIL